MVEVLRLVVSADEISACLRNHRPSDGVLVLAPFAPIKRLDEMESWEERFISAAQCLEASKLTLVWVR